MLSCHYKTHGPTNSLLNVPRYMIVWLYVMVTFHVLFIPRFPFLSIINTTLPLYIFLISFLIIQNIGHRWIPNKEHFSSLPKPFAQIPFARMKIHPNGHFSRIPFARKTFSRIFFSNGHLPKCFIPEKFFPEWTFTEQALEGKIGEQFVRRTIYSLYEELFCKPQQIIFFFFLR